MGGGFSISRRGLLGGVSLAGMLAAGLFMAAPAHAQATPGSAQCPLVVDTATCTGDVSGGFRSDRDATMTRLLFRNLTAPIAPTNGRPAIDVRPVGDLMLDLDASVTINSTDPGSFFPYTWNGDSNSPDAAVVLLFDPARQTIAGVINAGTVNARGTIDVDDQNAGAFFIADADIVNFNNSGTITATYTEGARTSGSDNSRLMSGVRIVGADQVAFRNDGTIRNTGTQTAGVFLEGRSVQLINTGEITATYNNPARTGGGSTYGPRPTLGIAIATPAAAARLEWRNTGTIRALDTTQTSTNFAQTDRSYFGFYGRGAIDINNGGTLEGRGLYVAAGAQNRTDDLTVAFTNAGPVSGAEIIFRTEAFSSGALAGRTSVWGQDAAAPAIVEYRNVDLRVVNSGRLTTSRLDVGATGDTVNVDVVNRGLFDGRVPNSLDFFISPLPILNVFGLAPLAGSATVRLANEGNMVLTRDPVTSTLHYLLVVRSSHNAELTNSGNITLAAGSGRADALRLLQGQNTNQTRNYVFDAMATLRNSGRIEINGDNSNAQDTGKYGLFGAAVSDLSAANSGAIVITHDAVRDPYSAFGALVQGFGNITFDNNAPITITSDAASNVHDGIGIAMIELSLQADSATALQAAGRMRGYDRARDLASRLTLNLNAGDVTVNAPGGIGVYGVLGVTRTDGNIDGKLTASGVTNTLENGNAQALITIASGVSVTGGSGSGAGINFEGAGRVTLSNAGSIVNRGDATSGGILLGKLIATSNYGVPATPAAGLTLNLIDAVNTGTINGGAGHGIWVQTGAITNLINRGTISGAVAAIQARDASQADNQAGGVIDGAIVLSGAGSTLRNGGAIRIASGAAATSTINGSFTQVAGGALALRGIDRFNVSGNFILAGDLNLALGAPSSAAILTVGGNLTLDGRLNVTDAGGFGAGVYRLFDYGGSLAGGGLAIGSLPSGQSGTVQTAVAGQINLVVSGTDPGPGPDPNPGPTPDIQFWDGGNLTANGAVDGGTGTWNNTQTNWTRPNGDVNEAWGSRFAVFQGAPGTVTIHAGGVAATGLQFAVDGYTLSGGTLTLAAPATLRVGDGSAAGAGYTATINNVIAGTAGVEKTDLGTLILGGANTYAGGTRVSSGVLQIAADDNLGAVAGGVALEGGTLRAGAAFSSARAFTIGAMGGTLDSGANAVTLSGVIAGSGGLTKTGAGTLTLSGNSTGYAGPTTLATGNLTISGTLGGIVNVNAGALNVTGALNGGANVNAGTMTVSGTVGGTTNIATGATLRGTGALGNLILAGILAPGNSPGTLTVNGNAILRAGSFYDVELAAGGATDLLRVTGTATMEGGTVRITALDPETQYVNGTRYNVLTAAGGRTGQFTGLTESSAFLDFALSYDANSAFVTVNVIRAFPDVAATFNQRQASTALIGLGQAAGSDSLAVYNQILLLDAGPARAAFDAASGEIYPVMLATALRHGAGRAGRLLGRSREAGGTGWGLWGSANGHDGRVQGDGNGARYTYDGIGGELGIDYRGPGNRWAIGFGGGYDERDVALRARASDAEITGWHAGGYARYGTGGAGLTASASGAYARGEADVVRGIAFGSIARTTTARVDVDGWALSGELRYGLEMGGGWSLGPAAWISHARAELGRFTETGANSLALSGGAGNDDHRTRYGGGLFARWEGTGGAIDATATYVGGGRAPTEVGLAMAGAPNTPYRVRSSHGDGHSVQLTLAGQVELGRGWSIGANVAGATGNNERTLQGNATLAWRF